MFQSNRLRVTIPIFLLMTSLNCACVLMYAQSPTQSTQEADQATQNSTVEPRRVVRGRGFNTDPIRIVGVFYDGKPIAGSTPFDSPNDWLSHISVKIRNASSKPLVAGNFQLTFEGIGGDTVLMHYIRFGIIPEHQLYTLSGDKVPRPMGEIPISPVAPGETITISFKNDYSDLSAKLMKRGPLSDVKECTIDYGVYYFTDGLRWLTNNYAHEDPSTPGNYLPSQREALMPTQ